ncbi:MAG: transcription antitermination factor NusB [Armatimonadetes bacterium]|nr:transcription antitermination factor NusB [Anaerolineae bacterium]
MAHTTRSKAAVSLIPGMELPELQPGDELIKEIIPIIEATNERSLARRLALQALYEIDSAGHAIGDVLNAQTNNFDQPIPRASADYAQQLVLGAVYYRDTLDTILERYAPDFPWQQIAIIDRNILRIATLEFTLFDSAPVGVAIDEAVELAKLFGADHSARFINGVLGALADDDDGIQELIAIRQAVHIGDEDDLNDDLSDSEPR